MAACMRSSFLWSSVRLISRFLEVPAVCCPVAGRALLPGISMCVRSISRTPVQNHTFDPEGKTTVSILNKDSEMGLMINSYSQVGFRLNNGMSVVGPLAIFPRSVLSWNINGPEDIDQDSLCLFYMLAPKIDILVIGVGDEGARLKPEVFTFLRSKGIAAEVLSTERACSTFNFLNAEKRYVAGALIPPTKLRFSDDDVILSKAKQKTLYEFDD